MIIKTGRFGQLNVADSDRIHLPLGVLGFPEYTDFCLVDPADDTLILWLQALENPDICFPVLEPRVFRPNFTVKLSAADQRELGLADLKNASVFSVLTIPDDVSQMTANVKAPLVINLKGQIAKQVVLQDNDYSIKQLMFKELRAHLMTIQSQTGSSNEISPQGPVSIRELPTSNSLQSLG